MATTRGFQHIHLFVGDLERSLRFYTRAFGMREAFREGQAAFLNTPGTLDLVTLHQAVGAGGRLAGRGEHGPESPFAVIVDPDGYHIELADWRRELPQA